MSKHTTSRGREFNMQGFVSDKGQTTAVGNSNRNAQGDLMGRGGKTIATAKEVTNIVYNNARRAVPTVTNSNAVAQEIGRKEIVGADGISRAEVTYADGSIEIQNVALSATSIDFDFKNINKEL